MRTVAKRKRQRETEPPAIVAPTASGPDDAEPAAVADQPEEPKANEAPKPNRAAKAKGAKKPSLWDYLDSEQRNFDGCKTKVYRLEPVIHKSGTPHYVTQRTGRFSEQDLLEECGTGRYDVWVKDSSDTLVFREQVSIYNLNFPPKVNPLELVVGDPQNEIYLKAWAPQSKSDKTNKDGATAGDLNTILSKIIERSGSFDPALASLWQQTAQQRDELSKLIAQRNTPPDVVSQLKQLKEILPTPTTAPQLDLLAILTQVKQLQGDPFSMLEKMKAFLPERPKQEAATSGLEQLKSVMEVVGQARELFTPQAPPAAAAVASPDADLTEKIAVSVSNQTSGIVNALPGIIMAFKSNSPVGAPAMGAASTRRPGPLAFNPYDQAAMRDFVRAQSANASGAAPTSAAAPTTAPPVSAEASAPVAGNDSILGEVTILINQALNCMNRGVDGHQAAQAFIDWNGDLAYDALARQLREAGMPVVIGLAKGIPELAAQTTMYEAPLRTFLEEFLQGPQYDDEDAEQESQPA
jgi:hypothetical protein